MVNQEFLIHSKKIFQQYKALGDKTFEQIGDVDINWRPDQGSNSIAIIVHHLSGNMLSRFTQFLTSDGEKEWRNRDDEFERGYSSKKEMIEAWEKGWNCVFSALEELKPEQLEQNVLIRAEPHLVMEAILRQLAHYSSHIGQILYIGKILKREEWTSLSIPKGQSRQFNQLKFGAENSETFSR